MKLNEKLKLLRKESNLTQKQAATAIGLTERHYQDLEYGVKLPSFETLVNIATIFNAPSDFLLGVGLYSKMDLIEKFFDDLCKAVSSFKFEESSFNENFHNSFKHASHLHKIFIIGTLIKDIIVLDNEVRFVWTVK